MSRTRRKWLGRRGDRGAVAVFTAMLATVILVVAALAVDLGNTWARRGMLQAQADRAAVFGAQYLPASTPEEELRVAKAVAYYFACNDVPGQRELNLTLPACPSSPSSGDLDDYADSLLSTGMVDLSRHNEVKVLTPQARIDFGFAGAADADGTAQQKRAAAKVMSPGLLSPMALSLDCMLDEVSTTLPGASTFGYVSTTHQQNAPAAAVVWGVPEQPEPRMSGISPGRVARDAVVSVQISGRDWPELSGSRRFVAVFAKSGTTPRPEAVGTLTLNSGKNQGRLGYLTVQVPSGVTALSGEWEVKVAVEETGDTSSRQYSSDESSLTVEEAINGGADSCGRLLKSPRAGTQANINFVLNLQNGLDHPIALDPGLLTGSVTLDSFDDPAAVTGCGGGADSDTNGLPEGTVPTCVVTNMSNAYEAGFTEGMIGAEGRLTCRPERPCASSFDLNGRTINDDEFADFVINPSLLTYDTFFDTDTYLTPGVPALTPDSNLKREIYGSHRFMWVAVISTVGATSAVEAGDYPVLTFRPIFIPQRSVLSGTTPLVPVTSDLAGTLESMDAVLLNDLGPVTEPDVAPTAPPSSKHGLLVDGDGDLSAVRFMTINPEALPAVPEGYSGPLTEYLGVGPKVVRLVE